MLDRQLNVGPVTSELINIRDFPVFSVMSNCGTPLGAIYNPLRNIASVCFVDISTVNMAGRFADYNDGELEEILNDRDSTNTKNVIKVSKKLLMEYISTKYESSVEEFFDGKNQSETADI